MSEEKEVIFMNTANTKKRTIGSEIRLFGSVRVLVISALFVAMSIVLGKFLSIKIGDFLRISFENLSLLMGGMMFGPLVGMAIGVVADLVGCFLYGYSPVPLITVGAAAIGFISGFVFNYTGIKKLLPRVAVSAFAAHIIGSMIIKSAAQYFFMGAPLAELALRIPIYIGIAAAETAIIFVLFSNKGFAAQVKKICSK